MIASTMIHDSHIRSDWLPMGTSRDKAKDFAERLTEMMIRTGAVDEHVHSGRRTNDADFCTATSPGGWIANHDGSATVKVRGCSGWRARAKALAPAIAEEMGITYKGGN